MYKIKQGNVFGPLSKVNIFWDIRLFKDLSYLVISNVNKGVSIFLGNVYALLKQSSKPHLYNTPDFNLFLITNFGKFLDYTFFFGVSLLASMYLLQ